MFRVTYTYYSMPGPVTTNTDGMGLYDILERAYTGKLTIHLVYHNGKELDAKKMLKQLKF